MRDHAITIGKGIAILLMVMGHTGCPDTINTYLGQLRMPLFFLVSGYCFKERYLTDAAGFLYKRVKGIYWPYVKWSLIFLLLHNVFMALHIYDTSYVYENGGNDYYSLQDTIKRAFGIITSMQQHDIMLDGYWFLSDLFFGSIIAYTVLRLLKKSWAGIILLLIVTGIFKHFNLHAPWFCIGPRTIMAAAFFVSGRWFKQSGRLYYNRYWLIVLTILFTGLGTFLPANMHGFSVARILPFYVAAISGVLVILNLSKWLSQHKDSKLYSFLVFTGEHTFFVLTWHFLCLKPVSLFLIWLYDLPVNTLASFPVIDNIPRYWWPLYFISGAGIPLLAKYCSKAMRKNHID